MHNKYLEYKCKVASPERIVQGYIVKVDTLSFLGDVSPEKCVIIGHDTGAKGMTLKNAVLVIRKPRGSTVGAYIVYAIKKHGCNLRAIILEKLDPVIVAGAIISEIPIVFDVEKEFFDAVSTGLFVEIRRESSSYISTGVIRVYAYDPTLRS